MYVSAPLLGILYAPCYLIVRHVYTDVCRALSVSVRLFKSVIKNKNKIKCCTVQLGGWTCVETRIIIIIQYY